MSGYFAVLCWGCCWNGCKTVRDIHKKSVDSLVKRECIKSLVKRYQLPQCINARFKSYTTKRQYNFLCKQYGTPSVLTDPQGIKSLGQKLWEKSRRYNLSPQKRVSVLYVGTDREQDRSGIIQGLSKVAELTLFENSDGRYGQLEPKSSRDIEAVRQRNGEKLCQYLRNPANEESFDIIIGQMWSFRMHWRALAEAREKGIAVVNISMDDRHAFVGRKLVDGTRGGTLGLAPYLSLACTDAPECVRWYEAEGCKAIYLPEASDPEFFRPLPCPKLYDICFVGAKYGIRAKLVTALQRVGVRVQVYGKGWPNGRVPTEKVPELFARSRIVLGCGTIGYCDDFLALKLRDFDGPMSGSLYLTHDNPDLYPLFSVGEEIVTFKKVQDAVEKVRYLLNHPDEREPIATSGRVRAGNDHTWDNRFKLILSQLGVCRRAE